MKSLADELMESKATLEEFKELTIKVLNYLPNILSHKKVKNDHILYSSEIAGTLKYVRPINKSLILFEADEFMKAYQHFEQNISILKNEHRDFSQEDKNIADRVIYTIQQSIGAGLDLLVEPNSARKHVGNRFEELIKSIFNALGITNKGIVLSIPYETDEGTKIYKCENDLILSPYHEVRSNSSSLDENEIVLSAKTTSKDRMGKIFIDKMLLEQFVGHSQKYIGIFLNDVQRKGADNISFTLVSGLFMVYTKFLTKLEGVYYLDLPPKARKEPYSRFMKPFSELLFHDVWEKLSS
ncbi:MAG: hypothetical protein K9I94_00035 [Bacteroidales bacterium]|nr:hypothetical protein [Bacteroidales bacterium]